MAEGRKMSYREMARRKSVSLALAFLRGEYSQSDIDHIPDRKLREQTLHRISLLKKIKRGAFAKYPGDPLEGFKGYKKEIRVWLESPSKRAGKGRKGWFESRRPVVTEKGVEKKAPRHREVAAKGRFERTLKQPIKKEPAKKKVLEMVVLPIDWDKQKSMAVWSKEDADQVADVLRPFIGKKMALYGGGWLGGIDSIVILKAIRVEPWIYYAGGDIDRPVRSDTDFTVRPSLKKVGDWRDHPGFSETIRSATIVGGKYVPPKFKERFFEPKLGSWKLGELVSSWIKPNEDEYEPLKMWSK